MPIYEYRCGACGWQQELLQKMSDAPLKDCPECGKPSMSKMVTAAGFHLKGSGWYVTDFKSGAKPQTKAITITADGTMYLDTYPVSLPELENLLRQYKAINPNLPVVVKADAGIAYQRVVDVLDIVGRLEITQLGLVTQRIVK